MQNNSEKIERMAKMLHKALKENGFNLFYIYIYIF
jgi:hypothetical protein